MPSYTTLKQFDRDSGAAPGAGLSDATSQALAARRRELAGSARYSIENMGRMMAGQPLADSPYLSAEMKARLIGMYTDMLVELAKQNTNLQLSADEKAMAAQAAQAKLTGDWLDYAANDETVRGTISNHKIDGEFDAAAAASKEVAEAHKAIELTGDDQARITEAINAAPANQMALIQKAIRDADPARRPAVIAKLESAAKAQRDAEAQASGQPISDTPINLLDPGSLNGTFLQVVTTGELAQLAPVIGEGDTASAAELEKIQAKQDEATAHLESARKLGARADPKIMGYIHGIIDATQTPPATPAQIDQATAALPQASSSSSSASGPASATPTTPQTPPATAVPQTPGQPAPSPSAPASPQTTSPGAAVGGSAGALPGTPAKPATAAPTQAPPAPPGKQSVGVNIPGTQGTTNLNIPTDVTGIKSSGPTPEAQARLNTLSGNIESEIENVREDGPQFRIYMESLKRNPEFQAWMATNGYTDVPTAARIALRDTKTRARSERKATQAQRDAQILGGAHHEGVTFGQQVKAAITKTGAPATPAERALAVVREANRRETGFEKKIGRGIAGGLGAATTKAKDFLASRKAKREDEAYFDKEAISPATTDLPEEADAPPPGGATPEAHAEETAEATATSPTTSKEEEARAVGSLGNIDFSEPDEATPPPTAEERAKFNAGMEDRAAATRAAEAAQREENMRALEDDPTPAATPAQPPTDPAVEKSRSNEATATKKHIDFTDLRQRNLLLQEAKARREAASQQGG